MSAFWPLSLLCVIGLAIHGVSSQKINNTEIYVNTNRGPIIGHHFFFKLENRNFTIGEFLGINFAKSPTGEFRFAHPVFTDWTTPQYAEVHDDKCYQSGENQQGMTESCIGANIWTPGTSNTTSPTLGVMIFIHGGRFETGSTSNERFYSRTLTAHKNVVTASVQYRLGLFGFLRLDSEIVPGNMGLKDQALGIQFISENIHLFGGDRTKITLAGMDAGAASVGYHMLNDNTRKFFTRAAFFGGSPMVSWAVRKDTASIEDLHMLFAIYQLGCKEPTDRKNKTSTAIELKECLQGFGGEFLINKQDEFNKIFQGVEFPPVIDGEYIKQDPLEAFASGNFQPMDVLIGVTDKTAAGYVSSALASRKLEKNHLANKTIYDDILRYQFYYYDRAPERLSDAGKYVLLNELTTVGDPSAENNYQTWIDAVSDRLFVCPSNNFADAVANKNMGSKHVFYYVFTEQDNDANNNYVGATHGSDTWYFLGGPRGDGTIARPEQVLLSEYMMNYLASFILTGDPITGDNDKGWTSYNSTTQYYFNLTTINVEGGKDYNTPWGFRRNPCGFWDHTLKYVNSLHVRTTESETNEAVALPFHENFANNLIFADATTPEPNCGGVVNDIASALLGVLLSTNVITIALIIYVGLKYKSMKSSVDAF